METVTKIFGGNDFYYLSLDPHFFHLSKDPSDEFEYSRNDAGGNLDNVPKVEEGESKKETKRPTCDTKFEYSCVLTKLCHQRFQCVDQLLLLHKQVGGRVPHNELRHLLLFLGKSLKFCLATILLTSTFETNWYLYSSKKQGG